MPSDGGGRRTLVWGCRGPMFWHAGNQCDYEAGGGTIFGRPRGVKHGSRCSTRIADGEAENERGADKDYV